MNAVAEGPGAAGTPAAFFDVDGTLVNATIVHYYVFFRRRLLSPFRRMAWYPAFLAKCLYYLLLDRIDRGRFNVVFYRNYAGLPVNTVRGLSQECCEHVIRPRLFAEAERCIQQHRASGCEIVLVTGSVDFIMRPLAGALGAQHLIAASLLESHGVFTGQLDAPPISDKRKALLVDEFARAQAIDLSRSFAYGDSAADLPMLERVGFPHAVNPDRTLQAIARQRGWPVHRWAKRAG